MRHETIESEILAALADMPVIDAHEHLMLETKRVARTVDFFLLFSNYCSADLIAAGMDPAVYDRLKNDQDMAVEEKWKAFSPFYPMVRYGSYTRPALIWLKDVLGYDDLSERNYKEVSARLQEGNRAGLYNRILRDMCHIETALNANDNYRDYDFDLLKPLWRLINFSDRNGLRQFAADPAGKGAGGIEAYLDWMERDFQRYLTMGRIGVKAMCFPFETPDMQKANAVLQSFLASDGSPALSAADKAVLNSVLYDRAFQLAQKHGLTVAVHSGVWGDFRDSQPTHLIPMAMRYPGIAFDLFHLGMPFVREAVMIGKMFPNVSLNLCWNTIVSPEQTVRMLDECVDMVPLNKIIAFGGDYGLSVEKIYGHLKMAKAVVARVLAKRIGRGEMNLADARRIAKMWFHDNPKRIYRL